MKLFGIGSFVLLICLFELRAQTIQGASQVSVPSPTPYTIVSQDANSRVWQSESYEAGQNGEIVTNIQSYKEEASGLNFLSNGVWAASEEQISVLPNGIGAATNGQHKLYFPGDLSGGQIEMVTPDGQQIFSQPLELSYFDGTNTVVLAELTNSVGVIVGNNQVVYPNAFSGLKADIRYTYTRAGLEQDVIIKQQPLTPEFYGLNPGSARLQMVTEFFNSPNPNATFITLPQQGGISLVDQSIGFGTMQMVPGHAFLLGQSAVEPQAMVAKSWLAIDGMQFLIEEIPVNAIVDSLAALPLTAINTGQSKASYLASRRVVIPQHGPMHASSGKRMLTKGRLPTAGFVLDYQTINSSMTNAVFQGDTTYFISGPTYLYGTNTFEGGAVLKYTNNASLSLGTSQTTVNWEASAYRPVVFTAMDDNSVGDAISGSSGNPSGYYANPALNCYFNTPDISCFRIAYAQLAIYTAGTTNSLKNGQIVNCQNGIEAIVVTTVNLENMLFESVQTDLYNLIEDNNIYVQNSTFNLSTNLTSTTGSYQTVIPCFTNCVFVNIGQLTNSSGGSSLTYGVAGAYNGFYNSPAFGSPALQFYSSSYPFQTVGAGNFYLATNSGFHNVGTTNIDPTLLTSLNQKTTYPPILYSNATIITNLTLSPQATRDTNAAPDLGYHYDPVDYLVDQLYITNATLTLTNGVAVAGQNDTVDIGLQDGSAIISIGSPLSPNWIIRYSSVQEQSISLGPFAPSVAASVNPDHISVAPSGIYSFTKFACLAGGGTHLYDEQNNFAYSNLVVQNCEFWGGGSTFGGGASNFVATLQNNLFERSTFSAALASGSYMYLTNNLFWGVSSVSLNLLGVGGWYALNNDFDSCGSVRNSHGVMSNANYNAYLNCTNWLTPTNVTDIFATNGLNYQTSVLGSFYQPPDSPLIQAGSARADVLGLYEFTTQTNQVKEGTAYVDIGYHYVAFDPSTGLPYDTYTNGIPDYISDSDGSGLPDWWQLEYFGQLGVNPNTDSGGYGWSNLQAYQNGINPTNYLAPVGVIVNTPGPSSIVP